MPINPKYGYQEQIRENEKQMEEIKKSLPNEYFNDKAFRQLADHNRMLEISIKDIERQERAGIKF